MPRRPAGRQLHGEGSSPAGAAPRGCCRGHQRYTNGSSRRTPGAAGEPMTGCTAASEPRADEQEGPRSRAITAPRGRSATRTATGAGRVTGLRPENSSASRRAGRRSRCLTTSAAARRPPSELPQDGQALQHDHTRGRARRRDEQEGVLAARRRRSRAPRAAAGRRLFIVPRRRLERPPGPPRCRTMTSSSVPTPVKISAIGDEGSPTPAEVLLEGPTNASRRQHAGTVSSDADRTPRGGRATP